MHSQEHTHDTHPTEPAAPWCAKNVPSQVGSRTVSAKRDADTSGGSRRFHTAGSNARMLLPAHTGTMLGSCTLLANTGCMLPMPAHPCIAWPQPHTRATPNTSTHVESADIPLLESATHQRLCVQHLVYGRARHGLLRCRCSSGQKCS